MSEEQQVSEGTDPKIGYPFHKLHKKAGKEKEVTQQLFYQKKLFLAYSLLKLVFDTCAYFTDS